MHLVSITPGRMCRPCSRSPRRGGLPKPPIAAMRPSVMAMSPRPRHPDDHGADFRWYQIVDSWVLSTRFAETDIARPCSRYLSVLRCHVISGAGVSQELAKELPRELRANLQKNFLRELLMKAAFLPRPRRGQGQRHRRPRLSQWPLTTTYAASPGLGRSPLLTPQGKDHGGFPDHRSAFGHGGGFLIDCPRALAQGFC